MPAAPAPKSSPSGATPTSDSELRYREEMEGALRREIQRRRRGDKVVRKQYQALATTTELVLSQPSRAEFFPALLWAMVRECDGLWAALWRITDEAPQGLREVTAYRDAEIGAAVEEFVQRAPASIRRLGRLHLKLCRENQATVILSAQDPRLAPEVRHFNRQIGLVSMVLSPMLQKGRLIGWISFLCAETRSHIEPARVAFIETATHQAVLFQHLTELAERTKELERIRERERASARRAEEATFISGLLEDAAAAMASSTDSPQIIASLVESISRLLQGRACAWWGEAFPAPLKASASARSRSDWTRQFGEILTRWRSSGDLVVEKITAPKVERLLQAACQSASPLIGHHVVALPLQLRAQSVGFLFVVTQRLPPAESERWLAARALALQAGLALKLDLVNAAERKRALTAERHRLGQDLHDLIAQVFSGIMLQMEALRAEQRGHPAALQARLEKIRQLSAQGVNELRRTLSNTARPAVLDEQTLSSALELLAAETTATTGVAVHFRDGQSSPPLDSKAEVHLYAIASEAIQNAIHHGQPARVQLTLHQTGKGVLRLQIRDNGRGFSTRRTERKDDHFGLDNMRRRARAIGATLSIISARGKGTTVTVDLPARAAP